MTFDIFTIFFEDMSRKFKFHQNLKIMSTLHKDQCGCVIISGSVIHRMRNISGKSCRENQNTHFMFNNFSSENRAFYEIAWKNIVEPDRPLVTI